MNFQKDKDGERRRKSDHSAQVESPTRSRTAPKRPNHPELGSALRTVYQRTIDEAIPPEMLDLLGKLG